MEHNVYHGEYSLFHWIDLLIANKIVLPPYQRHFVWTRKQVEDFAKTIKSNGFIPPVTIGYFKKNGKTFNYILDGQQRLSCLLFFAYKLFPKRGKVVNEVMTMLDENDDAESSDDVVLDWTLSRLTELGTTFEEVKSSINMELYEDLDCQFSGNDFRKHFLSFSYIVPKEDNEKKQQKFYATIFRNINNRGTKLNDFESRDSLYFLDDDKRELFKPDLSPYKLCNNAILASTPIDFVRYLAILSQYKKDGKADKIAQGFGSKARIEDYYEEYIFSLVGDITSSIFIDFNSLYPNNNYHSAVSDVKATMDGLDIPKEYVSIIDVDTFLFGLIYEVFFLKHKIDLEKKEELKSKVETQIQEFKNHEQHKKSPASLIYLRKRVERSIAIYSNYIAINE